MTLSHRATRCFRGSRSRRGFTLVEMLVSLAIFSGVSVFLAYLTILVGKEIRRGLAILPPENRGQVVMDRIRYKIMQAKWANVPTNPTVTALSSIVIGTNSIEFIDPTINPTVLWTKRSRIELEQVTGNDGVVSPYVTYTPDLSSPASFERWTKVNTMSFSTEPGTSQSVINVNVVMNSANGGDPANLVRLSDKFHIRS